LAAGVGQPTDGTALDTINGSSSSLADEGRHRPGWMLDHAKPAFAHAAQAVDYLAAQV
jgi:hypothetical protein